MEHVKWRGMELSQYWTLKNGNIMEDGDFSKSYILMMVTGMISYILIHINHLPHYLF